MKRPDLGRAWRASPTLLVLVIGALIAAFSYSLFLVPFNITAGGVGGISIIINNFTGWNIDTLYLLLNIPLLILGYFQLGRWVRVSDLCDSPGVVRPELSLRSVLGRRR